MIYEPRLIPECYADTLFIKQLSYRPPNHQHGIGSVANTLQKKYQNRNLAIGIIDEDIKGTMPSYFYDFDIREQDHDNGLILKNNHKTNHFLIVICPAFERWILHNANLAKVDPYSNPYNLPSNFKKFRRMTKSFNIEQNIKFKNFLNTLIQKEAAPIMQVKNWIDQILHP